MKSYYMKRLKITMQYGLDIEVGAGRWPNLPSSYPIPSLRSCLAGLLTREAMAEVGQLLWWRRVWQHWTRTALVGINAAAAFFCRAEIPPLKQMDGT